MIPPPMTMMTSKAASFKNDKDRTLIPVCTAIPAVPISKTAYSNMQADQNPI